MGGSPTVSSPRARVVRSRLWGSMVVSPSLGGAVQDQQILAGGNGGGFAAEELQHFAVFGGGDGELHQPGLDLLRRL